MNDVAFYGGCKAESTNEIFNVQGARLYPRTLTYRERGSTEEHSHTGSVALPTNTHTQGAWLYPRTLTYRERGSTHEHSHAGSVALSTNTHIQGA